MRNRFSDFGSAPGSPCGGKGVKIAKKSITRSKVDGFVSNLIWVLRAIGDIIYVTNFTM